MLTGQFANKTAHDQSCRGLVKSWDLPTTNVKNITFRVNHPVRTKLSSP